MTAPKLPTILTAPVMRKLLPICLFLLAAGGACGCATSLDSGYEPRRLGASEAQRRAFYSSPYSAETQQALQEDQFSEPQRYKY